MTLRSFNEMIEIILKGGILEMYNNGNEKFTNGTQEIWDSRRISEVEAILIEIMQFEEEWVKKWKKSEQHCTDPWDVRCVNISVMGIPERKKRK